MTRKKHSSLPVALKGTIFRSGISVLRLNFLYVCPVFRSDFILFVFHSDVTSVFCGFSTSYFLSLFVKICVIFSFKADTLTSTNDELLLTELFE